MQFEIYIPSFIQSEEDFVLLRGVDFLCNWNSQCKVHRYKDEYLQIWLHNVWAKNYYAEYDLDGHETEEQSWSVDALLELNVDEKGCD